MILCDFISSEPKAYQEICHNIEQMDLKGELRYARVKDKADRSLEIYKFYINALYVGLTRAIRNVYLVESDTKHKMLPLLGLTPSSVGDLALENQKSSLQDWQKEASKLEAQGKREQAKAIREKIMHTGSVPWEVITPEKLLDHQTIFKTEKGKKAKQSKIALLEYATVYRDTVLKTFLEELGVKSAFNQKKSEALLENKYYLGYNNRNYKSVLSKVDHYGVNFRDPFNFTPLMLATRFNNVDLIQELISLGADRNLMNNQGCNALQIALQKNQKDPNFVKKSFSKMYALLCQDSISISIDAQLIKIDNRLMEFFLFNFCFAFYSQTQCTSKIEGFLEKMCFTAPTLSILLEDFPESVVFARRKKRAYLSSILSKNEVSRVGPYNRKLFVRRQRGKYQLNTKLKIKIENQWYEIGALLRFKRSQMLPPNATMDDPKDASAADVFL